MQRALQQLHGTGTSAPVAAVPDTACCFLAPSPSWDWTGKRAAVAAVRDITTRALGLPQNRRNRISRHSSRGTAAAPWIKLDRSTVPPLQQFDLDHSRLHHLLLFLPAIAAALGAVRDSSATEDLQTREWVQSSNWDWVRHSLLLPHGPAALALAGSEVAAPAVAAAAVMCLCGCCR